MVLSSSLHPDVDLFEAPYAGHHRLNVVSCIIKSAMEVAPRTNSSLYLFAHTSCVHYQAKCGVLLLQESLFSWGLVSKQRVLIAGVVTIAVTSYFIWVFFK